MYKFYLLTKGKTLGDFEGYLEKKYQVTLYHYKGNLPNTSNDAKCDIPRTGISIFIPISEGPIQILAFDEEEKDLEQLLKKFEEDGFKFEPKNKNPKQ